MPNTEMPVLDVFESQNLLKKYGIPVVKSDLCKNEASLTSALKTTRFPLAMKVVSSAISHKTEAQGVKLGVSSALEAKKAFNQLKKLRGFEGALVQEMLSGTEIIIGGKRDATFGPTVLFGLGGIFVEVMKDVSLRVCPISSRDAAEMISEIKGYKLLTGFRGSEPVKLSAINDCLLKTSKMMLQEEQIKELDINPLFADSKGVKAVDARVVI
ncbi:MAG: acetate--CoA ligase family protein [Candidatus Diapherotrites archaeon]